MVNSVVYSFCSFYVCGLLFSWLLKCLVFVVYVAGFLVLVVAACLLFLLVMFCL